MKNIIFCIVGESGSGKTWVATELNNKGICPTVVSYTTRQIRDNETDGVEHHFVDIDNYIDVMRKTPEDIFAWTNFGGNYYWTLYSQIKSLCKNDKYACTYVIDEDGVKNMDEYAKNNFNIVTIRIKRDNRNDIDNERVNRDKDRFTMDDSWYDFVIENNGTKEELFSKVKDIICTYGEMLRRKNLEIDLQNTVIKILSDIRVMYKDVKTEYVGKTSDNKYQVNIYF